MINLTWMGCPFCSNQPTISWWGGLYTAECTEESCPVIVEVRGFYLEEVNRKWNTRFSERRYILRKIGDK